MCKCTIENRFLVGIISREQATSIAFLGSSHPLKCKNSVFMLQLTQHVNVECSCWSRTSCRSDCLCTTGTLFLFGASLPSWSFSLQSPHNKRIPPKLKLYVVAHSWEITIFTPNFCVNVHLFHYVGSLQTLF